MAMVGNLKLIFMVNEGVQTGVTQLVLLQNNWDRWKVVSFLSTE